MLSQLEFESSISLANYCVGDFLNEVPVSESASKALGFARRFTSMNTAIRPAKMSNEPDCFRKLIGLVVSRLMLWKQSMVLKSIRHVVPEGQPIVTLVLLVGSLR